MIPRTTKLNIISEASQKLIFEQKKHFQIESYQIDYIRFHNTML